MHSGFHAGVAGSTSTVVGDAIEIIHTDHWAKCCPECSPSVVVTDRRMTLTYNKETDCDSDCSGELSYRLVDLEKGSWTVEIPDGWVGIVEL